MNRKRVLAITGIRSEYFFQRPVFSAIRAHPGLELELVVAGAHLSPLHGHTIRDIEADGFPVVGRIESLLYSDRDAARLKGAATELQHLTHLVDASRPDWLLASGDREDPMMLALCGAYMNIPVAHYCAGDRVVGNVDDMVRHAISRLSHLLLTTHEGARERLIRSGEQPWRVHNVGHAGLDRLAGAPALSRAELARRLDVPAVEDAYVVVIQHPISSESALAGDQMRETLEAVAALGIQAFVSYPNSDAGSEAIIRVIEAFRGRPRFHIFRNVPDDAFVNLLRGATALLGNSSLGLLEAPFLRLPVINAGNRQKERHHAENVFFVPHDRAEIAAQVRRFQHDADTIRRVRDCTNPFGDGRTGSRIADLLASTPVNAALLNKDLTF